MLQARNDTGRPQGGQQVIVGLDKARQTGVAGHICHSRTGRQRSGGPGGSGRSGRPGRPGGPGGSGGPGGPGRSGRPGRPGGSGGSGRPGGPGGPGRSGGSGGPGGSGRPGRPGRPGGPGGARRAGDGADPHGLAGRSAGGTGTIGIQRLGGNGSACAVEASLMIHKHNLHPQDMRGPAPWCGKRKPTWRSSRAVSTQGRLGSAGLRTARVVTSE